MIIAPLPVLAGALKRFRSPVWTVTGWRPSVSSAWHRFVPPLITDRMSISFPFAQSVTTTDPIYGQTVRLPVGLSSLSIPALARLRPAVPDPAITFRLACGKGPQVTIDGHRYATRVTGTVGDLTRFLPVQVGLCTPCSTVPPGQGQHRLTAAAPGPCTITDVSLTTTGPAVPASSLALSLAAATSGAGRSPAVRVLSWQAEKPPGASRIRCHSYLEVHQNANAGWSATLNGKRLAPVRLDGWQQDTCCQLGRAASSI